MKEIIIPSEYQSSLSIYETQTAIGFIKRCFEEAMTGSLKLKRVSAPLFVKQRSGLNDDLSGAERPVTFDVPALYHQSAEVVHSLAKWKRMALHQYDFHVGNGLYADMNAIRRDEELDNLHSIYVDQWDWERVISVEQRTEDYLKATVQGLVNAIGETASRVKTKYPSISTNINTNVSFITSQALEDLFPDLTPKEREHAYVKEHPTTFIMQIGDKLASGQPHDLRAPDYDDWTLNGDLLFWHEPLQCAMEISSMGIRVDATSLVSQLEKSRVMDRLNFEFHAKVVNNELPLTIGGGIGQSRLCMLLLEKVHIGEVQVSLWDAATLQACKGKVALL
ncbi:aspartate--ammonia ligase [Vagococcus zengguangii]|uniref:Aspartate--ammonia ligase n=1 Tax=Vagococcus zengguangii TaxID=2571750 RepID=A0A4D7CR87_9ENTE|nr:aspartate--ammonia ligase [Vagococcus zengguangii]QCI86608.1 aspartate--ammonia ligase [Vagococcus zengguangii]TLG79756.1 aspartate--ammonia ligase [Vagococcus zengguangii]